VASISASKDMGRKFENAVYWSVRRKTIEGYKINVIPAYQFDLS
jgi:hypothetical protein